LLANSKINCTAQVSTIKLYQMITPTQPYLTQLADYYLNKILKPYPISITTSLVSGWATQVST
jgi:hypothetical protein